MEKIIQEKFGIFKFTSSCRAKPSKFDTRSPCLGHQSSALRKLILGSDHHNYYCLLFLMQLDRMIDDRMLSFHSQVLGIMAELRSKDEVWLVDGLATDSFPDNNVRALRRLRHQGRENSLQEKFEDVVPACEVEQVSTQDLLQTDTDTPLRSSVGRRCVKTESCNSIS